MFSDALDPKDRNILEYQGYTAGGMILVPSNALRKHFYAHFDEVCRRIQEYKTAAKAKSMPVDKRTYIQYAKDHMATILAPIFDVSTGVVVRRIQNSTLEDVFP